jgi:anti-anti-sigma factor
MEITRQSEGVVQLKGELHISEAEELRSALLGELAATPALVLELSGVDSCDTASFQLLCSLRRSAEREGKALRISVFSAAMREASAILGLSLEDLTFIPLTFIPKASEAEVREV